MSIYSSLNTAFSGMAASQTSLYVTSNNISNADTTGYSKQCTVSVDSSSYYNKNAGVMINEIYQSKNNFLNGLYYDATSELNYSMYQSKIITEVEGTLGGLNEYNLANAIDDFFYGFDELAKSPNALESRAMVLEYTTAMVEEINKIADNFDSLNELVNLELENAVIEVNNLSESIAQVNDSIMTADAMGNETNELIDHRSRLIEELSRYGELNVTYQDNGMADISFGNCILVNGNKSLGLEVESGRLSVDGYQIKLDNGMLKSAQDLLSEDYDVGLGAMEEALDILINTIIGEVNTLFTQGFNLNDENGHALFVPLDPAKPLEAGNLAVNPILSDLDNFPAGYTDEDGDGSMALAISQLMDETIVSVENEDVTLKAYLTSIYEWVGMNLQSVDNAIGIQSDMSFQIQNQILSITSVSLDDEMANVIRYQQAYNANAKIMSQLDEMLDLVINRMGIG